MKKIMFGLAVALLTTGIASAFTAEDILKVQPGMNIKEVEALLGKPRLFSPATQEALGGPRKRPENANLIDWAYRDKETKREVVVTYDRGTGPFAGQSKFRVVEVSAWDAAFNEVVGKADIKIGATPDQVKAALGAAYKHLKILRTDTGEEWEGRGAFFHFANGALTKFRAPSSQ